MKGLSRGTIGLLVGTLLCAVTPASADTVLPVPAGSGPSGLTTDGAVLYLNSAAGGRDIYTLRPSDAAVLGSFPGYFETIDLEFDGLNRIFLSNAASSTVEEITLAGVLVNSFAVPFRPGAIAFDGTNLHIFDFDSSLVRVTDRSGAFVRSYLLTHRPTSAVWDPSTGRILTVDEMDRNIRVLDTDGNVLSAYQGPQFNTGTGQGGVTIVGSSLYIVGTSAPGNNADRIHVLDTVCGDGHLGPGEQCDDGNTSNGDCCSSTCQYEASASPCADGNPCTVDACDGAGTCQGEVPTGCKAAGRSSLLVKNAADDSRDTLIWKWVKGAAAAQADWGDGVTLCFYAGASNTFLGGATTPDGAGVWSPISSKGWKFNDPSGQPDGITKIVLKGGTAGRSKIIVKGRGLSLPDLLDGGALDLPVRVQMVSSATACFESLFPSATSNDGTQFKAKQ